MRHDTIEEVNVDWKAECCQLRLAREIKNKKILTEETKTNKC